QMDREEISEHAPETYARHGVEQRRTRVSKRVVRRRVKTAKRRGQQSDGCSAEYRPNVNRVVARELSGLIKHGGDDVAERKNSDCRGNDKEGDSLKSLV